MCRENCCIDLATRFRFGTAGKEMACEAHGGEGKWYPIDAIGILTRPEDEAFYLARLAEFSSLSASLSSISSSLAASLSSSLSALSTAHSHCLSLLTQAFEAETRRTQQHFHSLQQVLAGLRAQLEGALVHRDWQLSAGLRTVAEGKWQGGKVYVWDGSVELVELVGSCVYRSPVEWEAEEHYAVPDDLENMTYIDLQKAYISDSTQHKTALKSRLDALKAARESCLKHLFSADCESCQALTSHYLSKLVQSGTWDSADSETLLKHTLPWSKSFETAAISASVGLQSRDSGLAIEWLQRTLAVLSAYYSGSALYRACQVQLSRDLMGKGRVGEALQTVEQDRTPETLTQWGELLLRTGELETAKTALKTALRLSEPFSKDWGRCVSALSKAYFQLEKPHKASHLLLELQQTAKDVWRDVQTQANCLHNASLQALAQSEVSDSLEKSLLLRGDQRNRAVVLGYHLLGRQQAVQGLLQDAIGSFQLAKQLAIQLFPSHLPYIQADLVSLTQSEASLVSLEVLYILEEDTPAPLQGIAEVLEQQAKLEAQDWKAAERLYLRAKELTGNCAGLAALYTKQGLRAVAEALWRGRIETLAREQPCSFALADAKLSLAQLISPEAEAIVLSTAACQLYKQQGQRQLELTSRLLAAATLTEHNRLAEAETALGELDEDWSQGWEQLGRVYEKMYRLVEAEDCYWKAEQAGKRQGRDTAGLWLRIGLVRELQGCFPEAIALLSNAECAVEHSLQPLFQTALGRLYRLMGNSAQAEAILTAIPSETAEVCYELGQLYLAENKPDQAQSCLHQAVQTAASRDLRVNALRLLASVQDSPQAAVSLEKAIEIASSGPIGDFRATQSWFSLAELEIEVGHLDSARTFIQSGLEYTVKTLYGRIVEALALATALYLRLNSPWKELSAHLCCLLSAEELDTAKTEAILVGLEVPLPIHAVALVPEVFGASRAPALLQLCQVFLETQEFEDCLCALRLLDLVQLRETQQIQQFYLYAVYFVWLKDWSNADSALQQVTVLTETASIPYYKQKILTLTLILEIRREPDLNQALAMLFSIHSLADKAELQLLLTCSLEIGQSLHAENQLAAAEECWRWAVEAAEQGKLQIYEGEARKALGKLLLRLGIEDEGQEQLEKAGKLTSIDGESCALLGKLYAGQKRLTEAREMYELAVKYNPADLGLLSSLSTLLLDLDEIHLAEEVLQQALQQLTSSSGLITPNSIEACLALGDLYGRLQQPLQEQYIYSLLWHLDLPVQWKRQVTQRLADGFVRLGLSEEAVTVYKEDKERWEREGLDWPAELKHRLGLLYIQCRRFSEAQAVLSPQSGLELYTCGQAYSQVQAYPLAIECLEASLDLLNDQEKCTALKLLGEIYSQQKQWTDANRILQAAFPLTEDLSAVDIQMSLSKISTNQGQLKLASEQLNQAIVGLKKLGENSEVRERLGKCHCRLAQTYERMDRPEEAEIQYIEAVKIWEQSENGTAQLGDLYYNLGVLYQKQRQFSKAEDCFLKELSLQASTEKQADTHHSLGLLYCTIQRYDLAQQHYLQAIHLCSGPAKAESLCGLGKVYRLTSQTKEARDSLEAAVAIYEAAGDGKQAKRVRKLLASLSEVSRGK